MKLTLALTTLGFLVAQVAAPAMGELGPWAQLGTAGVLSGVVWLLIGELRASRADAATQRTEFNAAFKGASDRWHEEADQDRAVMMKMVQTCSMNRYATVEQDVKREEQDDRRTAQDVRRAADAANAKPTNKSA
jgi:hypothetical protein